MRTKSRVILSITIVLAAAGALAAAPPVDLGLGPAPVAVGDVEGVTMRIFREGRVYVAGQPSADALRRLAELGVTAVVNLRTQAEMDNRERVPYDEAALAAELGLEYVHLPIGGDDQPFRPEVIDRLDDVLRRHPGPVLLHCTVAWRASWAWAAYLVKYQGISLDDALARGEAIGLDESPIEGLLGRDVKMVFADEAPATADPVQP